MLQIVYGVPGSGKTYYAVYSIKKIIEKEKENVILVSNIENLKLPHLNLDDLIQQYGGLEGFFNVDCEFWNTNTDKKKILFIDEAQRYFHKKFFSTTVFFFFQYHRHLFTDIFLITQSLKALPTELVVLSELVVQAAPSSFRFFKSSLRYFIKDIETGEVVDKFDVPLKKDIYSLYTSAVVIDNSKKMTYPQRYVIFSVLLVVIAGFVLFFVFPKLLFSALSPHHDKSKVVQKQNQKQNQNKLTLENENQNKEENINSLLKDGYSYPSGITSKGYVMKEISNGEFLNKYRNGVVYDLTVNYIKVYNKDGTVRSVYLVKDIPSDNSSGRSDGSIDNTEPSSEPNQ